MTVGRCGSTALMNALQDFPDIATPGKNIECADHELLHPDCARRYARQYAALAGREIRSPGALIEAFYRHNAGYAYAGFKSMPNRHRQFQRFAASRGIQFITLVRRDVASTVASFMVAMQAGCWRREGGVQTETWTFDPARLGPAVAANLAYVLDSLALIASMPGAIALAYEDLCREDFASPELDGYFDRPVRLPRPKPPLSGSAYTANWPEFLEYLSRCGYDYDYEPR
jgi:hypothetical protein